MTNSIDLSGVDLLRVIAGDAALRRVANTQKDGPEYAGSCPFCGGTDRFRVWPNHRTGRGRWRCMGYRAGRAGCGRGGDAIDYLQLRFNLSFKEALSHLGLVSAQKDFPTPGQPRQTVAIPGPHTASAEPPGDTWQARARRVLPEFTAALWSPDGERALRWLRDRMLSDETIRDACLGYNPADHWESWDTWGLEPRSGKRGIWLPRGIAIPWQIGDDVWRLSIRRPVTGKDRGPKYLSIAGSGNGLYNAADLNPHRPAQILEGELDTLTVKQLAADLVVPVATGATSGSRRLQWIARLAICPLVLVSFDAEQDKGDKASLYWLDVLANAIRWRPYWEDVNAMAQAGMDVRLWVETAIEHCQVQSRPVSSG